MHKLYANQLQIKSMYHFVWVKDKMFLRLSKSRTEITIEETNVWLIMSGKDLGK